MRIISFFVAVLTIISCSKKGSEGSASSDPSLDASILRGEAVYKQSCIACHMADGGGAPPMNPPLIATSFIKGDKATLIGIVLKGMNGQPVDGQKYHNVMPPLDMLSNRQIADVLTYVRNNFGNKESAIDSVEVEVVRQTKPEL